MVVFIDWFEVFVSIPRVQFLDDLVAEGCSVEMRAYGTRIYHTVAHVYDHEAKFGFEVRCHPKSLGVLSNLDAHIKIDNKACYMMNPATAVWHLCVRYGVVCKSITRVDLCHDFMKFESGIPVQNFVKRVLAGTYKRGRAALRKDVVQETWEDVTPNYIAWKDRNIYTRLYDKTLELQQVASKEKQSYIVSAWIAQGLYDNVACLYDEAKEHVWRLEFQIQSESKGWVAVDGSGYFLNDIDSYLNMDDVTDLFSALIEVYFAFWVYKDNTYKDDCDRVKLFKESKVAIKRIPEMTAQKVELSSDYLVALKHLEKAAEVIPDLNLRNSLGEVLAAVKSKRGVLDSKISKELIEEWQQKLSGKRWG